MNQNYKKLLKEGKNITGLNTTTDENILAYIENNGQNVNEETLRKIIDKYKQYTLSYRLSHLNQEDRYIKKEDKLIDFGTFVFRAYYFKEFNIPKNDFTKTIFGDNNFEDIYTKFIKIDRMVREKRKNAKKKFKL